MRQAAVTTSALRSRRTERRRRDERMGRLAEWLAAARLVLTGHRILARRQRTPQGELDLIAVRGRRIVFAEVKWRRDGNAVAYAVTPRQAQRIARAAEHWLWRQPRYRNHTIGLDVIQVTPWRLPRHLRDALQPV